MSARSCLRNGIRRGRGRARTPSGFGGRERVWPQQWQYSPVRAHPQLRQFFSCVWPSAPPAAGSTARATSRPVTASPTPSRSGITFPRAADIMRQPAAMLAQWSNEAHRTSRRLVQPGPSRPPPSEPCGNRARSASTKCGGWSRRAIRSSRPRAWRHMRRASLRPGQWLAWRRSGSAISSTSAGTRYTIDTLRKLKRRYPGQALHLADGRGYCCSIPSVEGLA